MSTQTVTPSRPATFSPKAPSWLKDLTYDEVININPRRLSWKDARRVQDVECVDDHRHAKMVGIAAPGLRKNSENHMPGQFVYVEREPGGCSSAVESSDFFEIRRKP